jgi:hypothetical protein
MEYIPPCFGLRHTFAIPSLTLNCIWVSTLSIMEKIEAGTVNW